jgi:hypothetical protein
MKYLLRPPNWNKVALGVRNPAVILVSIWPFDDSDGQ